MRLVDKLPSVFDKPLQINEYELVLVSRCNGLCKYNIRSKEWTPKWIPYPDEITKLYTPRSCFDKVRNLINIYDSYGRLLRIDTLTKRCQIIDGVVKISYPRLICTQGTLHLIGGWYP
eukprot:408892_1